MMKTLDKAVFAVFMVAILAASSFLAMAVIAGPSFPPSAAMTTVDGTGASLAGDAASLASSASVSEQQARMIAMDALGGTVTGVELENENGKAVYAVGVTQGASVTDVKIDATTGAVLRTEQGETADGKDQGGDGAGETGSGGPDTDYVNEQFQAGAA